MACAKNNCSNCCSGCNGSCARRSCSSCSGCTRSCCNSSSRMGALRSVTGPFSNCGNWWNAPSDFPFYTGPCGYAQCCNDECCPPYPPAPPYANCANAYASFSASAPVTLTAGGTVALSRTTNPDDAFSVTGEGIRIFCPGVYMVNYTVNVPEDTAVTSSFYLALNGSRISASTTKVTTANDATSDSYTMHTLVQANAGDLLTLMASNEVSIASSTDGNVFTLTLAKLS